MRKRFWSKCGKAAFPLLSKAAVLLLSAHATTGAAERNWSKWSLIYQKNRAALTIERAEMLVFIQANLGSPSADLSYDNNDEVQLAAHSGFDEALNLSSALSLGEEQMSWVARQLAEEAAAAGPSDAQRRPAALEDLEDDFEPSAPGRGRGRPRGRGRGRGSRGGRGGQRGGAATAGARAGEHE